jgi:hypothetical protein
MNIYHELKQEIHQHCQEVIQSRITTAKAGIDEVHEFLLNDDKSSAGDKHETSRAMAHLEIENRQVALQNLIKMHSILNQFDPAKSCTQIIPGALLVTDNGIFYITISLGKVVVNHQDVLVISYQAPIITALKNTLLGSITTFHGNHYKLLHIA